MDSLHELLMSVWSRDTSADEAFEALDMRIRELEQAASALYGLALTRCQGRNDPLFAAAARVGDVLSGEDKGNG